MELTSKQRQALASICDTFAPGDGADIPSASALGAVEVVEGLATANPRRAEVAQLAKLLSLWDTRIGGLLLGRGPRRFSTMSQADREATLLALADSPKAQHRSLFQALKGAATTAYYLTPGATGTSPLWSAMGYPGPLGPLATAARTRVDHR